MFVDLENYTSFYEALTKKLLSNGHANTLLLEQSRIEFPPTLWNIDKEDFQKIFGKISENPRYFYRYLCLFNQKEEGGKVPDKAMISGLRYLEITLPEDRSISQLTDRKLAPLLWDQFIMPHSHKNNDLAAVQTTKNEDFIPAKLKGIAANATQHLTGRSFWLYFSPDEDKDVKTKPGQWLLVRSIIEFIDVGKVNLSVRIRNNATNHRFDYEGFTDFDHSGATVLVIKLFQKVSQERHLTIMLDIELPQSTIFLGQYLNYNNMGSIFSASLVLEERNANDDSNLNSNAEYYIIKGKNVPKKYPESVKKIAPYFYSHTPLNRTPKNVFNLKTLAACVVKKT